MSKRVSALLAAIETPRMPELSELDEMLVNAAMLDESDRDDAVVGGLLIAANATRIAHYEDEDLGEFEMVTDGPGKSRTWDAEKVYIQAVVMGYRAQVQEAKELTDDEVCGNCTWYTFPSDWVWPKQVLQNIAYRRGVRDGIEAQQMSRYYAATQGNHTEA